METTIYGLGFRASALGFHGFGAQEVLSLGMRNITFRHGASGIK